MGSVCRAKERSNCCSEDAACGSSACAFCSLLHRPLHCWVMFLGWQHHPLWPLTPDLPRPLVPPPHDHWGSVKRQQTPSFSSSSGVFISLAGGTCINQMQRQVSSPCTEKNKQYYVCGKCNQNKNITFYQTKVQILKTLGHLLDFWISH